MYIIYRESIYIERESVCVCVYMEYSDSGWNSPKKIHWTPNTQAQSVHLILTEGIFKVLESSVTTDYRDLICSKVSVVVAIWL